MIINTIKLILCVLVIITLNRCDKEEHIPIKNDILYMRQRLFIEEVNIRTLKIKNTYIAKETADSIANASIYIDQGDKTVKINVVLEINRADKYIRFNDIYFPLLKCR